MTRVIEGISPATYQRHSLHDLARDWPETNCYVDLWIELLHAQGCEPLAALSFTVLQDFEGDQFTFFKFPTADLETLYGVRIDELSIFDDVVEHARTQVARGRMPLIEVDGFYLPDTKGISYRTEHTKTTVGVNRIDPATRQLEYFHNAGYYALSGDDFDGLFRLLPEQKSAGDVLFPYVEFAKFNALRQTPDLAASAQAAMARHLRNRPALNPIRAYQAALAAHAQRLQAGPPEFFHKYTFNVLRQLGSNHELLSAHLSWLAGHGVPGLDRAIAKTAEISAGAKTLQFQLARAVARRSFDSFGASLERLATAYGEAFVDLEAAFSETASPVAV